MRRAWLVGVWVSLLACGGADGSDAGVSDAPGSSDGDVEDAAAPSDTGEDAPSPPSCGTAHLDPGPRTQLTRGLVVGGDGTLYFTVYGQGVGRVLPDGTIEPDFAILSTGVIPAALALDAGSEHLYASVPDFEGRGTTSVYAVDLATREVTPLLTGGPAYGLAVGPDGLLYVAGGVAEHVVRIDPARPEEATMVTTSPIGGSLRGLRFEPSGTLLVASGALGTITRLVLAAGVEVDRDLVTTFPLPSSMALDAEGRIYVTSEGGGIIARMLPDGSGIETVRSRLSGPDGLDFGRGALACDELYVVSDQYVMRVPNDTPGGRVLWE